MSTKSTIRFSNVQGEPGFHVYRDWDEDYDNSTKLPEFIHLALEGCEFEASHKNGLDWVDVKIPTALAREIGLITEWLESRDREEIPTSPTIPKVGSTYLSLEDPTLTLYVESVDVIEADELVKAGFVVTCRPPAGKGDPGVASLEIVNDEWESFLFMPIE